MLLSLAFNIARYAIYIVTLIIRAWLRLLNKVTKLLCIETIASEMLFIAQEAARLVI